MRFLEKVGPSIENKLEKAAPEKKPQEKPKAKGGKITGEDYDGILSSFRGIMAMEEVPEGATRRFTEILPGDFVQMLASLVILMQGRAWLFSKDERLSSTI